MSCKQAQKLLGEYLDGRLEGNLKARLEQHLRARAACAQELAALGSALEKVRALPLAALPEGFVERTNAAIRQKTAAASPTSAWASLRWLAPALGILVIGIISWWQFTSLSRFSGSSGVAVTPEAVAARDKYFMELQKEIAAGTATPGQARALERVQRLKAGESISEIAKEDRPLDSAQKPEHSYTRPSAEAERDEGALQALPRRQERARMAGEEVATAGASGPMADLKASRAAAPAARAEAPGASSSLLRAGESAAAALRAEAGGRSGGNQEIYFNLLAPAEKAFQLQLSSPTGEAQLALQSGRKTAIALSDTGGAGAGVWQVSLVEGKPGGLGQHYYLFVPSRRSPALSKLSLEYLDTPAKTVLAEMAEKSGLVILAPASSMRNLNLDFREVPSEAAVQGVATSLGLQVETKGRARNLVQ